MTVLLRVPAGVIYVADTACCGQVIHDPLDETMPLHWEGEGWKRCRILRYWEFRAFRQVVREQTRKSRRAKGPRNG